MTLPAIPNLSRRRFLSGASAVGLAGLAPSPFIGRAFARACPWKPDKWGSLEKELYGQLLRPEDSRFAGFAAPFNLVYETQKPAAIALCANRADVETAVKWAAANRDVWAGQSDARVVVRSGGHSYAGYSSGPGLMIDVSQLKRYSWDSTRTRLTVECGARNGDVYNILRAENRALTHGRCPTVGIAGFLLGGGIGFNMRLHGVGSDRLLASTIVTANGETLNVSAEENEDLFWACRGGGGGNFGINTSFTLDTVAADDRLTVFKLLSKLPRERALKVIVDLMAALDAGDPRLGSRFKFSRDYDCDNVNIDLIGQFHGGVPDVRRLLSNFLKETAESEITEMSYWEGQEALLDWEGPFRFTERSAFLKVNLDEAAVRTALEGLWTMEPSSDEAFARDKPPNVRFFQTGGRMNDIAPADTAFVHRNSKWLMDFGLPWSADDDKDPAKKNRNRAALNAMFDHMLQYTTRGSYQNFADPDLADKNFADKTLADTNLADKDAQNPQPLDWPTAYYGDNYQRLAYIKYKYDQNEFFKFKQSIRPMPPPTPPGLRPMQLVPPPGLHPMVHSQGG